MVPEKMVCGSINQNPEKRKEAGPPHCPVIHDELPNDPQQTQSQDDLRQRQLQQVTKKMRQWPKRPRDLPWPPKSVPAEIRDDERKAGHFLCPLVTVDFVTELPPLESSDHHNPALRWSLLLHIMELRKNGLEYLRGYNPCRLKSPPDKTSVANSHVEVESQGHSHAMGETHAQGGGQTLGGENPLSGGQALGGGQVLGGGEISVGGPQQMALMFEMIKGMQQNQVELAESLRQLREANGNKEDHQKQE
uniref:Uncharacterized protein n=1 Tax=Fagus sylvatica TaxID=28930 RepID=A0A2N9FQI4_FAGSY